MAQVLQFARPPGALDPEALRILGAAYDLAVARLRDGASHDVCTVMASRIIAAGIGGERDFKTLCALALRGFAGA
jgi:hypothetical protein